MHAGVEQVSASPSPQTFVRFVMIYLCFIFFFGGWGYQDGIHLCTFPEGTRSRTGRIMNFKNGAFKMAHKAGAPVIPISIVNSHKVMPTGWMMAMRPAHGLAQVIVHEPVESEGKTEEELAQAVRESMIQGLPEDQVPL
jgi:1-acyl-sn-glycerol-3-phosphate acyltransferase